MLHQSPHTEPMVLGSPTRSPPQHSFYPPMHMDSPLLRQGSDSPATQYAPSFLLGGKAGTPGANPNRLGLLRDNMRQVTWSPDLVQRIPNSPFNKEKDGSFAFDSPKPVEETTGTPSFVRKNRAGFPPLRSLSSEVAEEGDKSFGSPSKKRFDPRRSLLLDSSRNREELHSNGTPSQDEDVFFSRRITPEKGIDPSWVTVYGFPPEATAYILQKFSEYGTVQRHVIPSKGNWMHLQYASPLHAGNALSKNNKIFNDTLMIGVSPCTDKEVIEKYRNLEDSESHLMRDSMADISRKTGDSNTGGALGLPLPPWQTSTPALKPRQLLSPGSSRISEPVRDSSSYTGDASMLNKAKMSAQFGSSLMTDKDGEKTEEQFGDVSSLGNASLLNKSGMRSLTGTYGPRSPTKDVRNKRRSDGSVLSQAWGYVFGGN